jgi:hypothetical protein
MSIAHLYSPEGDADDQMAPRFLRVLRSAEAHRELDLS